MIDTKGAERSRRYRRHKAGDHSLCAPDRPECKTVTPSRPPSRDADPSPGDGPARPYGLRARGRRMWDQLVTDTDPVEVVVLVEEICRTADRLDRLDAILNGRDRSWIKLELPEGEAVIEVVVDKLLGEARQQQMAFKGLLGELRAMRGASAKTTGRGRTPQSSSKGVAGVADIAARIAARRSGAAG